MEMDSERISEKRKTAHICSTRTIPKNELDKKNIDGQEISERCRMCG